MAAASENMLELNHQMPLRSGVTLMPLAQWISHPGGWQRAATARIVGLRLILTLRASASVIEIPEPVGIQFKLRLVEQPVQQQALAGNLLFIGQAPVLDQLCHAVLALGVGDE